MKVGGEAGEGFGDLCQIAFSPLAVFDVGTRAYRLIEGCFNSILLFENLHHELRLNLIQLLQRHLQNRSVFI